MKKLHCFLFLFAILFFIVMTAYCLFIKNHYNGDTLENIKNTIHVFYDDLPKNEIQIIYSNYINDLYFQKTKYKSLI